MTDGTTAKEVEKIDIVADGGIILTFTDNTQSNPLIPKNKISRPMSAETMIMMSLANLIVEGSEEYEKLMVTITERLQKLEISISEKEKRIEDLEKILNIKWV